MFHTPAHKQPKSYWEVEAVRVKTAAPKNSVWFAIRAEAIKRGAKIDARRARLAAVSAKRNALGV